MSKFGIIADSLTFNDNIVINGVSIPDPSEPVKITFNNISDVERPADSITMEGSYKGTKVNIELHYTALNKQYYDSIFNATQGAYLNNSGFFMSITVPTYTPLGRKTFTGYFMSSHTPNCTNTTDSDGIHYGQTGYDELHEDVTFSFVEK